MDAEDIRKKFAALPSQGLGWGALFALSVILFVVETLEKLAKGNEFVGNVIRQGIVVTKGVAQPANWLVLTASFLLVVLLVLVILLLQAGARNKVQAGLLTEADRSNAKARHNLTEMMFAASRIRAQQTPAVTSPIKAFDDLHIEYRVEKDFTATINNLSTIRAMSTTDPVHFWEKSIQPFSEADPMEYLSDITFSVIDITDPANIRPVTYLQTQNDPRLKKICMYFLPRLRAGDPARIIKLSYRWPRYFAGLHSTGREELSHSFNSADKTNRFWLDFYLQDGTEGAIAMEALSSFPFSITELVEPGWKAYRYQALDVPAGRQEHKVSVSWRKI